MATVALAVSADRKSTAVVTGWRLNVVLGFVEFHTHASM